MPTVPRLMLQGCTTLACAGVLLASGMASSGAAGECSESYKICNVGCGRGVNGNGAGFCKIQCDYRLIACDQQSAAAALTQGGRYSISQPSER
jgi:hypothetical protein